MIKFSLVIPFYKRTVFLRQILETLSLQACELQFNLSVFVVDSNSVSNLLSTLQVSTLDNLNISILNTSNSLSAKRNLGASCVVDPYIAFLDDDCIPDRDYIKSVLTAINSQDICNGIFTGQASFPRTRVCSSQYISFRQSLLFKYPRVPRTECPFLYALAMNCVVPKSVFDKISFNESFSSYGWEDHDFFLRISDSGLSIINAEFAVFHFEQTSISNYLSKMLRYGSSLHDVLVIAPRLFSLLPFSKYLLFIPVRSNLLLRLISYILLLPLFVLKRLLSSIDKVPLFFSLSFLFRFATILAFFVGYLNPRKLSRGQFV